MGPLAGLRAVEFTQFISAPFAGLILSDMGAEVVKVETPEGDPWRIQRAYVGTARGKKSITLDFKQAGSASVVERLVRRADIVLVNLRPDVTRKFGLDYERLRAITPDLIYGEITGFGDEGPLAGLSSYEQIAIATTGIVVAEGKAKNGLPHMLTSTAIGDNGSGASLAAGILAALYHRARTGRGQRVATSLYGACLGWQSATQIYVGEEEEADRAALVEELRAVRASGAAYEDLLAFYQSRRPSVLQNPRNIYIRGYRTGDGYLQVACWAPSLQRHLSELVERFTGEGDRQFRQGHDPAAPDEAEDAARLVARAEAMFASRPSAFWLELLRGERIPAGPVQFPEEVIPDPQARANGYIVDLPDRKLGRVTTTGPWISMSETPLVAGAGVPDPGDDNDDVLLGLGMSAEEIERLRAGAVIT